MKYNLLSIFLCLSFFSYSQQKNTLDTSSFFNKLSKKLIVLKTPPDSYDKSFSFSGIKVIDKRLDTSAIGYMRIYKPAYENCKLSTANDLKYDLESFFNKLFKPNNTANNSLVIVVRKFWFYKKYYIENDRLLKSNIISHYTFSLGIDCFSLADSTYTPLIKKDTVIVMDAGFKESEKGALISSSLRDVLISLSLDSVVRSITRRKKFSSDELNEYYNNSIHLSIINDTILKKGVYRSFDEFKRNAPFYTNFDVKKGRQTIINLIDGKDTIPTRNLWGYCTGKRIFIKNDGHLFELQRQGSSLAFMGNKELINVKREGSIPLDILSRNALWLPATMVAIAMSVPDRFQFELVPLRLDIESGKVY
jgi:hypothetical protein